MARQRDETADDPAAPDSNPVTDFWRAYDRVALDQYGPAGPDGPIDLRDPGTVQFAEALWRPVSPPTDEELDAVEGAIGLALPPRYREFVRARGFHLFLDEVPWVRFPRSRDWRAFLTSSPLLAEQLVPVAYGKDDWSPSVFALDHRSAGTPCISLVLEEGGQREEHVRVFSSFEAMLRVLTRLLRADPEEPLDAHLARELRTEDPTGFGGDAWGDWWSNEFRPRER